ncbi:hypothetical protein [uncultured Fluviicola sp.]|uniref:hypothetical protein n=1 Tax=uncultured Fluviicola sp. TaxID=463303 RepID=UPI0025E9C781|nr:hypothetical protein [uncultured Fluviicola sp.]
MHVLLVPLVFLWVSAPINAFGFTHERSDSFPAKPESKSVLKDSIHTVSKKDFRKLGKFDSFLTGPRINYTQGKHGFLGLSGSFMWHEVGYVFQSHIGFAAGMDLRLTKSMVYAPKFTFEYRYVIGLVRVGYYYFTDLKSDFEHRVSAEIGLSFFSFLDITYLHSFGSSGNPFHLDSDYLNFTATIPLNL